MGENYFLFLERYNIPSDFDSLDDIRTSLSKIYRRNKIRMSIITILELMVFAMTFTLIGLWYYTEPNKAIPISLIIYTVYRMIYRLVKILYMIHKFKIKYQDPLNNQERKSKMIPLKYSIVCFNIIFYIFTCAVWLFAHSSHPLSILMLVLLFVYPFLGIYLIYNLVRFVFCVL